MSDYKFDTFYYSVDKSSEHYLSEIENLPDMVFRSNYHGKMYCPWCKKPQLSLVKRDGITFLRTYPGQGHAHVDEQMCPYECDVAPQTVVEEYIEKLQDEKKIKSMLEAVMRSLFKQEASKAEISASTTKQPLNPLLIERIQKNGIRKKNVIPHYSFKSWGKNIPQDQLLILYGKVYVELIEMSSNGKPPVIFIHFRDIRSKKLITSCKKPEGLTIADGYYYVVALGKCYTKTSERGYVYYNLRINFPDRQSIILTSFSPRGTT